MSPRSRIGWICDGEFDVLRKFIESTSTMLRDEAQRLRERVEQLTSDEDETGSIPMELAEQDQLVGDIFPALASAASFVMIYSLLEHILMVACRDLQAAGKLKLSVRDLTGSGIEAAKTYLQKVCGLPFPDQSKEWQEIKNLQRVRNILVHRNGQLDPVEPVGENKDRVVREYLESKGSLLVCFDEIFLTDDFCLMAIGVLERFFKLLIPGLPDFPTTSFEDEERNRRGS